MTRRELIEDALSCAEDAVTKLEGTDPSDQDLDSARDELVYAGSQVEKALNS